MVLPVCAIFSTIVTLFSLASCTGYLTLLTNEKKLYVAYLDVRSTIIFDYRCSETEFSDYLASSKIDANSDVFVVSFVGDSVEDSTLDKMFKTNFTGSPMSNLHMSILPGSPCPVMLMKQTFNGSIHRTKEPFASYGMSDGFALTMSDLVVAVFDSFVGREVDEGMTEFFNGVQQFIMRGGKKLPKIVLAIELSHYLHLNDSRKNLEKRLAEIKAGFRKNIIEITQDTSFFKVDLKDIDDFMRHTFIIPPPFTSGCTRHPVTKEMLEYEREYNVLFKIHVTPLMKHIKSVHSSSRCRKFASFNDWYSKAAKSFIELEAISRETPTVSLPQSFNFDTQLYLSEKFYNRVNELAKEFEAILTKLEDEPDETAIALDHGIAFSRYWTGPVLELESSLSVLLEEFLERSRFMYESSLTELYCRYCSWRTELLLRMLKQDEDMKAFRLDLQRFWENQKFDFMRDPETLAFHKIEHLYDSFFCVVDSQVMARLSFSANLIFDDDFLFDVEKFRMLYWDIEELFPSVSKFMMTYLKDEVPSKIDFFFQKLLRNFSLNDDELSLKIDDYLLKLCAFWITLENCNAEFVDDYLRGISCELDRRIRNYRISSGRIFYSSLANKLYLAFVVGIVFVFDQCRVIINNLSFTGLGFVAIIVGLVYTKYGSEKNRGLVEAHLLKGISSKFFGRP